MKLGPPSSIASAKIRKITDLPLTSLCALLFEISYIFLQINFEISSLVILPATYRIDNGYVYIHTHDGADMLFKIQDSNTLVGESFFNESTYRKVNSYFKTREAEQ